MVSDIYKKFLKDLRCKPLKIFFWVMLHVSFIEKGLS